MSDALTIRGLTKKYKEFKLDNVNIDLPTGCIMGFIGENGAGKSTTIKLILGLLKKDAGEIKILGKTLNEDDKDLREQIGVVMDECSFPVMLNAHELDIVFRNCYKTWNSEKYESLLKKYEIPLKKRVKDFSKGMKMKLSIAAALSHDSRILILDEATGGLDPIVRDEILEEFLDFIQDESHSIFISSHIVSDLEKICDYITFIHKGKIIFSENKDELMQKYSVVKCSQSELEDIDSSAVVGVRKNSFGVEALVEKDRVPRGFVADNASIEDIMLFYVRGEKR